MRDINDSTNRYRLSAELSSFEGYAPGSSAWWNAIRYHNEFTFPAGKTRSEYEKILSVAKDKGE